MAMERVVCHSHKGGPEQRVWAYDTPCNQYQRDDQDCFHAEHESAVGPGQMPPKIH